MDKSPRANAEQALKDLAGITPKKAVIAQSLLMGVPVVGPNLEVGTSNEITSFILQFSTEPTLDQYERKDGEGYEVQMDSRVCLEMKDRLDSIWDLFHPQGPK
ncbi:hypothetical protein EHF33_16330 (plasmid) [Deinococcus psychrotolerans]|uniref:Uncharacterized protein n=1 Tax=Deinococcus psychrotolerans TaxID=2489213 RepID=A0A3G8YGQ8_9DEIO|nr:hypothetical protein [Deinococcus psychrotolerans]AZI44482.1 hypothetical protein EHF33_16330 [Deinococcus psychrotolerans]